MKQRRSKEDREFINFVQTLTTIHQSSHFTYMEDVVDVLYQTKLMDEPEGRHIIGSLTDKLELMYTCIYNYCTINSIPVSKGVIMLNFHDIYTLVGLCKNTGMKYKPLLLKYLTSLNDGNFQGSVTS